MIPPMVTPMRQYNSRESVPGAHPTQDRLRASSRWLSKGLLRRAVIHGHAVRVAWCIRGIRNTPIGEMVLTVNELRYLPRLVPLAAARSAATRACRIVSHIYPSFENSCLSRSLVFGALTSDREEVELHIGFRTRDVENQRVTEGHSWITHSGVAVVEADPATHELGVFRDASVIPLRRSVKR